MKMDFAQVTAHIMGIRTYESARRVYLPEGAMIGNNNAFLSQLGRPLMRR